MTDGRTAVKKNGSNQERRKGTSRTRHICLVEGDDEEKEEGAYERQIDITTAIHPVVQM